MVEEIAIGAFGYDEIERAPRDRRRKDSLHLGDGRPWRGEVVQRTAAEHDVERGVQKGQRLGVAFLEQDIVHVVGTQPLGTHLQQRGGRSIPTTCRTAAATGSAACAAPHATSSTIMFGVNGSIHASVLDGRTANGESGPENRGTWRSNERRTMSA